MSDVDVGTLERLFEAATVGLKILHIPDVRDPDSFRYLACNQVAAEALGLRPEQVVGKRLLELFPAVRGTVVIDHYQACVADQRAIDFGETSYDHGDGRVDWFRANIVPLGRHHVGAIFQSINAERESREALAGLQAALEDRIATRTRELEHEQRRLQAILDSAADPILEVDGEGRILSGNHGVVVGADSLTQLCGQENWLQVKEGLRRAARDGGVRLMLTREAPRRSAMSLSLAPIANDDGEERFVAVLRDTTKLVDLERERHTRERMATLGTLAAGIGHEINNPLQYISLNVEYLQELLSDASEDVRAQLEEIAFGADRIRDVVEGLRHFVRGRDPGNPELVDVRTVIDRALRMADHEVRHRATLERDYEDVPWVRCRSAELSQVILNVVVNAAQAVEDAAGKGRIGIHVRRDGDAVEIAVSDNGPGLSPADCANIFNPFWTTRGGGRGTGLGLSVSQDLMLRNGGTILVDSAPGRGATFRLRLPVHSAAAAQSKGAAQLPSILIVDDEVMIGNTMARALKAYDVVACHDYATALGALDERAFDVVVCDLALGTARGEDLFREFQQRNPGHRSHFIFITGGAAPTELKEQGLPMLKKPFKMAELRALVERYLREAGAEPA